MASNVCAQTVVSPLFFLLIFVVGLFLLLPSFGMLFSCICFQFNMTMLLCIHVVSITFPLNVSFTDHLSILYVES